MSRYSKTCQNRPMSNPDTCRFRNFCTACFSTCIIIKTFIIRNLCVQANMLISKTSRFRQVKLKICRCHTNKQLNNNQYFLPRADLHWYVKIKNNPDDVETHCKWISTSIIVDCIIQSLMYFKNNFLKLSWFYCLLLNHFIL